MTIYLLVENYCNYVDSWERVVGVYSDDTVAGLHAIDMQKKVKGDQTSYSVEPWLVDADPVLT